MRQMKAISEKPGYERIIRAAWLLFALLLFLFPIKANAAVTAADVDVDYGEEYAYVKKNDSDSLYFAFSAAGKTVDPKNYIKVFQSAVTTHRFGEDECEAFVIDLSNLNATKASQLILSYSVGETPFSVDIPAQKKLTVKYRGTEAKAGDVEALYGDMDGINLETGYFAFEVDGKAVTDVSDITWRTGNGTAFRPMEDMLLEVYLNSGATIYFKYCDGESPSSKLVKVRLRKIAKAPTVKIDGAKLTITIKSNMQYRVITDEHEGYWINPGDDVSSLKLGELTGISGDGLYTSFGEARIEVRVAATEKAHASRAATVYLDSVSEPLFGADGIEISFTNGKDDTKGLTVKNNASLDYQIAVVEKNAWDSANAKAMILKIDGSAKKGQAGYVTWKKAGAGKTVKLSNKLYSELDAYVILVRIAPVKEDTKTAEREFRVASVTRIYGGITPKADLSTGAYVIGEDETKTVTFDPEEGFRLFTSLDGAAFAENASRKVAFTASAGSTHIILAYFQDETTGEKGDTATFTYRFITGGELSDYAGAWGYNALKKLDTKNNNGNNYAVLYQRIYLGFLTYNRSVDISDLTIDTKNIGQVIKAVWIDNPQLIQAETGCSYTSRQVTLNIREKTVCDELLSQCENSYDEIVARIASKYGSVAEATKIQKVKEIHDYLVLKKEYKHSAFDQTMAGCLSETYTPVCMSYTLAFKWCCNRLGIQCEIIIGNTKKEAHAWNIVNYGEDADYSGEPGIDASQWYEMDVTWDDPVGPGVDYIGYTYFNVTTDFMKDSRTRDEWLCGYAVENCTGTALSYGNCVEEGLFEQ